MKIVLEENQLMKIRILIQQQVDTDDFELGLNTRDEDISYLVDRFAEDIEHLVKNNILREQIEMEYMV
jgi:hypothetical protein